MSKINTSKPKEVIMKPVGIMAILLVLQILLIFAGYYLLRSYLEVATAVWYALAISLVIYLLNKHQNPAYQIAWVIIMCLMPIFGGLFFLVIQLIPGTRRLAERVTWRVRATSNFLPQNKAAVESLREHSARFAGLADYLFKVGVHPTYTDTRTRYYPLGDDAFPAMLEDLEKAEEYIFMEFFIVAEGKFWDALFEVLKRKAAEGVTVRFMYDGTNMFSLPKGFQRKIIDAGINCRIFSPLQPVFSTYQNNRDHRKILVIDGKVGYTGGINLADEYINEKERFGHWKDTVIRLEGDAVQSLQAIFLQLWHVEEEDRTDYARWLDRKPYALPVDEPNWVIPYADAPEDGAILAQHVYMHILNMATRYVHIMTPYLILDYEMVQALIFAARRGVDVAILMPHVPDKKIPFYIARSFYPELIRHGVRILEYEPGFVHAKTFVSDDCLAVVGTINLDYRSLYLHFENGVLVYNDDFAAQVEADFQASAQVSHQMTIDDYNMTPWHHRAIGRVMRIFGPLM
ncbi:cardiolipin synthase [Peptococcus simiae]|uniref:cardiolipin synthase n=1 Tax=Peptococcus simiae TaxID=1643805 RepID=UPI003980F007